MGSFASLVAAKPWDAARGKPTVLTLDDTGNCAVVPLPAFAAIPVEAFAWAKGTVVALTVEGIKRRIRDARGEQDIDATKGPVTVVLASTREDLDEAGKSLAGPHILVGDGWAAWEIP